MDDKLLHGVKWFAAGFALAAILAIGVGAAKHYVLASVAVGLLCFACGIVVMQFLALRKAEKASRAAEDYWLEEFNKLEEHKAELEKDKKEWELNKSLREGDKDAAIAKAKAAGMVQALITLAEEGEEGSQKESASDTDKQ
jgi:hypothetical protein